MTTRLFLKVPHAALLTLTMGVLMSAASAQPAAGMHGDMKHGRDMGVMMTDMQNQMMAIQPSGNADVDFAMMMKIHHQGAITMAEAQLKNGKDAQMRTMAKDIIRAQKKEIAVFDKFLAKRGNAGTKMGESGMQMKK